MENTEETRDGILILCLERHPQPLRLGRYVCRHDRKAVTDGCCPWASAAGLAALEKMCFLKKAKGGWTLTPKGVREATRVWNVYARKEKKPELLRAVPAR